MTRTVTVVARVELAPDELAQLDRQARASGCSRDRLITAYARLRIAMEALLEAREAGKAV